MRQHIRPVLLLFFLFVLPFASFSCGEVDVTAVDPASVLLEPESETFRVGEVRQFTARAVDALGNELRGRSVSWSISDPAVATVDGEGRVTGLSPGEATVEAIVEGVSGQAAVHVMARPVETVEVLPSPVTLSHGGTVQLQVTLRASDGTVITGPAIGFASENTAVATVDGSGLVRAVGEGTTRISATAGGKVGYTTVTVGPEPVATVEVTPPAASILVGEVVTLTAKTLAADGDALTGRQVTWTTSDGAVATVDAGGVVTGAGPGTATITATSEGAKDSATVTVAQRPVAKVTVSPETTSLLIGGTATLTALVEAEDGTPIVGRAIAWTSETATVATVAPAGGGATATVTAVAAGTSTITATVDGVSGTATVTVAEPVASVTITPASVKLAPGATQALHAELRSSGGTVLTGRTVSWTTSDPAVFALAATSGTDVTGTAGAAGSATITATAEGVSGNATVTVALNVGTVTIAPASPPDLLPGQGVDLTATVRAADGTVLTDRPVNWTADQALLTFNTSGSMNASARITALPPACAGESCTTPVTAAADGVSGHVTVRVLKAVATIGVSPANPAVNAGGTVTLTATPAAADGTALTGRQLSWSSLTPALATVDPATGVVTGAANPSCAQGQESCAAKIRVTAPNDPGTGSDDVFRDVTVAVNKPVATVQVSPQTATVVEAGTRQFTATALAADGTPLNRPVSWTATPGAIATVAPPSGPSTTATGKAPGTATITARAQGVSGTAQLTVIPRVAQVTIVPNAASLVPGGQQSFTAELRDGNGGLITGRPISWTSSDPAVFQLATTSVATVSGTALKDGSSTVTATADGVSGTAAVTVLTPVATVTVVPPTASLAPGDAHTFTAELRDAGGNLLTGRTVTWTSEDPAVFQLSAQTGASVAGTAKADGQTRVVASAEGHVGVAAVIVTSPVHSITIVPDAVTLRPLAIQSFTAQLWDVNGNPLTGRAIDWSTNNPLVFLLSSTSGPTVSGTTAVPGTATITATSENASASATVTVTLSAPAPAPEPELSVTAVPPRIPVRPAALAVVPSVGRRSGAGAPRQ